MDTNAYVGIFREELSVSAVRPRCMRPRVEPLNLPMGFVPQSETWGRASCTTQNNGYEISYLNSMQCLLQKLIIVPLIVQFTGLYWILKFIIVFISSHHWANFHPRVSQLNWVHITATFSPKSVVILCSYKGTLIGLLSVLFLSRFLTNTVICTHEYFSFFSHMLQVHSISQSYWHTGWRAVFVTYVVEMDSSAMKYIPSFMKIFQPLKSQKGEYTDTQTAWWSHKPTIIFSI
jgi:hypothetical protein